MFAILCIFPLPRNSFVWYSVIYDGVFRVRAYDQIYWQHILAGLFCCCLLAVYLYAAVPVRSPIRRTRIYQLLSGPRTFGLAIVHLLSIRDAMDALLYHAVLCCCCCCTAALRAVDDMYVLGPIRRLCPRNLHEFL